MRQRIQSASRLVAKTRVSGDVSESRTAATAPSGQFFRYQALVAREREDRDEREDGDRAVGEPAVERARDALRSFLEQRAERDRDEDEARQGEPGDAADREDGSGEREPERRHVEERQPAASLHDGEERERGEEIEGERVPARVAAPPLGDELAAEGRIDEQEVVVARGVDRPVRRRQQRERGEDERARRFGAPSGRGSARARSRRAAS